MSTAQTGDHQLPLNRVMWMRFRRAIRSFARSEVGAKGKLLFGALIAFLLLISGLNVVNSYVGRDFMTAIAERNPSALWHEAILYVVVFAASTLVAGIYRFSEERLGLLWREWMTRELVTAYLRHPTYYRLGDHLIANGEIANPDQRIAEDVRTFTASTLSFVLLLLNGSLTAIAFSGVLWTISPLLFFFAVGYAFAGTYVTIRLGFPLIDLSYAQLDKEANFRADLVHVRMHGESVALLRQEDRLQQRLLRRIADLNANFRRMIGVNLRVGLFTTGYNYLIQIAPALIVAPMFFRGEIEFGVVTQSAMAFAQLLSAFSLIVTQFQSLSSFTAVTSRLGSLTEALEQAHAFAVASTAVCEHARRADDCPVCRERQPRVPGISAIWVREEDDQVAYEHLTLRSARDDRILIGDLSVSIRPGTRVLIAGDAAAKVALFRVTAGIWDVGEGHVIRPRLDRIMFLPERPYLPPATLRDLLVAPGGKRPLRDEEIHPALQALGLESALVRAGGLDTEHEWTAILSLGEQHLVAVARIIIAAPQFAFLDRPQTALTMDQLERVLSLLREHAITYLTVGDDHQRPDHYEAMLELAADGSWTWTPDSATRGTG